MKDPFSSEVDPYPEDAGVRVSRRALAGALVSLQIIAHAVGGARPRIACPTLPANEESCRHRFCRYFRGVR